MNLKSGCMFGTLVTLEHAPPVSDSMFAPDSVSSRRTCLHRSHFSFRNKAGDETVRRRVLAPPRAGSDDGVCAAQTHSTGELLQQTRDGAGGTGSGRLEAHCGAVCSQEELPHRLQTHLTLRGERTPSEETQET